MVLNSVLKVVSASTSLLIRHNKVREGCVYLSKVHSSKEANVSVTLRSSSIQKNFNLIV